MKKAQFPVAYKREGSTKESADRHIQELLDSYNCYIAERLFGTKRSALSATVLVSAKKDMKLAGKIGKLKKCIKNTLTMKLI